MKYLIPFLASLLFFSISHVPETTVCNIVGEWKGATNSNVAVVKFQATFRTDGTYTQTMTIHANHTEGKVDITFDGQYRISDGKLIRIIEKVNVTNVSPPSEGEWSDMAEEVEGLVTSELIMLCDESAGVLETYNSETGETTTMIKV